MKKSRSWCAIVAALAAVSWSAPSALAQRTLSGPMPTGVHVYYDENVTINGVVVTAGSGTTFNVIVHNGFITVAGAGIDGAGQAGADGVGSAGQSGTGGYSVVLETTPLTMLPVSTGVYDITVGGSITCTGGAGGSGSYGDDGVFDVDCCEYTNGENGFPGAAGSPGGNITISSAGDISIGGSLDTSGGRGGNGGSGGKGNYSGLAQPGSAGGSGGWVIIEHNMYASSSAVMTFSGELKTFGGAGGHGGNGGDSGWNAAQAGGYGGQGGGGGAVYIFAYDYAMSTGQTSKISTDGGTGGIGGHGGGGRDSSCVCLPPNTFTLPAVGGAASGAGGHGGPAGDIAIISDNQLAIGSNCGLSAIGGPGGSGNFAGFGGRNKGYFPCGPVPSCDSFLSVGQTLASGNGGAGGEIALSCVTLTINSSPASLVTTGGNGPVGVNGTLAGVTCCGTPPTTYGGTGGQGGEGGQGGGGGNILVDYVIYNVPTDTVYSCCGGLGGSGGNGGNGKPGGQGGVNGGCGSAGALRKNGAWSSVTCVVCPSVQGQQGVTLNGCGGS